jgi:hypothetical protein
MTANLRVRSFTRRRSFTLIELLLSIILLAGIVSGLAAWLQTTAQVSFSTQERLAHERSLRAFFALIADDLIVGDTDPDKEVVKAEIVGSGELHIRCRGGISGSIGGPVDRTYRLDPTKHSIEIIESSGGATHESELVGEIAEFDVVIEERKPDVRILVVTVASRDRSTTTRRYALP